MKHKYLTEHQEEVMYKAFSLLSDSKRVLIKGSAGTGKTFLLNELTKMLNGNIVCSAPTNKAVQIIREKVDNPGVIFSTTHSIMSLKRKINKKTGAISFEPDWDTRFPPLKDVDVLIIDEASMINTELLLHIEEHATLQNCKIIFVGDDKQLNPVGERLLQGITNLLILVGFLLILYLITKIFN